MAGGSFVGLDIGSNQIKVAEMRRSGSQLQVSAIGIGPTPQDAYDKSEIVDAQMLGKAIKDLLKQSGISTKDSVSSVSGQSSVVVRVIEVPQMNQAELSETMKWEVERHVPFNSSEVVMDWARIDRPEGYAEGQNMDVLLAVAQQSMIDRHLEMLSAAGLKPKHIDVEPLAICRTLLDNDTSFNQPGHTVTIINIGAANTEIGIYRDKLLTFPRTLPLAGDNLTRAIAQALGVDLDSAETYKREYGEVVLDQLGGATPDFGAAPVFGAPGFQDFSVPAANPFAAATDPFATPPASTGPSASPSGRMPFDFSTPGETPAPTGMPMQAATEYVEPPAAPQPSAPSYNLPASTSGGDPAREALKSQIFAAMAPVLAELAQEVRRSLDYYRGRTSDGHIHEIMLVGGTSRLKNIAQFLEMELGVTTRVVDSLPNIQVTAKSSTIQQAHDVAALFPISIGLGARDLISDPSAGKSKTKKKK
jgi:type IV pilus assembly protein PilM